MTYAAELRKKQMEAFAECFYIHTAGEEYRYTTYKEDVVFSGNTYLARSLQRSDFSFDNEFKSIKLKIIAPLSDIALKFLTNYVVATVFVEIYRVFISDPTAYSKIFDGEIIGSTFVKDRAEFDCESKSLLFRDKLPKVCHQAYCNNTLFDAKCALVRTAWRYDCVIAISGSTLISPTFATFADDYFTLGIIETSYGDKRMVTNHVGNIVTLHSPFDSRLLSGHTVKAYAGCDKAPATCRDKFSNFDNFVGFPYIPSSNPVIWGYGN